MSYKRTASLYVEAAMYRAALERKCKKDGLVVDEEAFRQMMFELENNANGIADLDPTALLHYQHIVQVALVTNLDFEHRERLKAYIDSVFDNAVEHIRREEAKRRGKISPDREVIIRASDQLSSDLQKLLFQ